MKTLLIAIILTVFAVAPGKAADPGEQLWTCASWNTDSETGRIGTLHGWFLGIVAADSLTSEEIMSKLWPRGHRVGGVKIEVEVACLRRENRNRTISDVLIEIAKRLNGVSVSPVDPYVKF